MEVKEFIEAIESGKAQVLTLEKAKQLKGKKLLTWHPHYHANYSEVEEWTIGEIINEWEFYKNEPMTGYESRTAYWDSYMTERQKKETKETFEILDIDGKHTYFYCHLSNPYYSEPTFTCTDADREVYFIVVED